MIGLIQLVSEAKLSINHQATGHIEKGIVALIGIEKTDTLQKAKDLFTKIINYRIFKDDQGKMNLSLSDIKGGLLLVPQFTLVAETNKGMRPGFSRGMPPELGKKLFEELVEFAKQNYSSMIPGEFGAYMQIYLCNEGPVTFSLQA